MSGSIMANREELMQDFVDAFDVFIAALAEHGSAAKSMSGVAVLAGGPPPGLVERVSQAQVAFETARDQLVTARERLGPMRLSTDRLSEPTGGPAERLWTPGGPRAR